MNELDIIVFDFETTGLDPVTQDVVQIAAQAYNCRTLDPYEKGDFSIYLKPHHEDTVSEEALRVNGLTLDFLYEKGVDPQVGWQQFADWINTYNKKRTRFGAPIGAGKNIRNFDMRFIQEAKKRYFKKPPLFFSDRVQIDLEDLLFAWFENDGEVTSFAMDKFVRPYFGLSMSGAHNAVVDVQQTGELITRFLRLHRLLKSRKNKNGDPMINFKGVCKKC